MKIGSYLLVVATLAITSLSAAQEPDKHAKALTRCREFVTLIRDRNDIPGMSVAVGIGSRIVWTEGFGFADREQRVVASSATRYRVGSVSKVLTTAALALLMESGSLDLNVSIREYVPEFPDKGHVLTTRHLAGHLGGIRHYSEEEVESRSYQETHYESVIAALDIFKDDPLLFPPGTRYAYSSYAWTLISAIIERASDQPFLEYMQGSVFAPLGMKDTHADDVTAKISHRTSYYDHGENAPNFDPSYCWAGAGFVSTVNDLVRFGSAHLPGSGFLRDETLEQLFTRQKTNEGIEQFYGIGWLVDTLDDGSPVYFHGGLILGGQAVILIRPSDQIVVAILANQTSPFGPMDANIIADEFAGTQTRLVRWSAERAQSVENREKLVATLDAWINGIETANLELVLTSVSNRFQSELWPDRDALARHMSSAFAKGPNTLTSPQGHLKVRGTEIGALAYFDGLEISGSVYSGTLELKFQFEQEGWRIIGISSR